MSDKPFLCKLNLHKWKPSDSLIKCVRCGYEPKIIRGVAQILRKIEEETEKEIKEAGVEMMNHVG